MLTLLTCCAPSNSTLWPPFSQNTPLKRAWCFSTKSMATSQGSRYGEPHNSYGEEGRGKGEEGGKRGRREGGRKEGKREGGRMEGRREGGRRHKKYMYKRK